MVLRECVTICLLALIQITLGQNYNQPPPQSSYAQDVFPPPIIPKNLNLRYVPAGELAKPVAQTSYRPQKVFILPKPQQQGMIAQPVPEQSYKMPEDSAHSPKTYEQYESYQPQSMDTRMPVSAPPMEQAEKSIPPELPALDVPKGYKSSIREISPQWLPPISVQEIKQGPEGTTVQEIKPNPTMAVPSSPMSMPSNGAEYQSSPAMSAQDYKREYDFDQMMSQRVVPPTASEKMLMDSLKRHMPSRTAAPQVSQRAEEQPRRKVTVIRRYQPEATSRQRSYGYQQYEEQKPQQRSRRPVKPEPVQEPEVHDALEHQEQPHDDHHEEAHRAEDEHHHDQEHEHQPPVQQSRRTTFQEPCSEEHDGQYHEQPASKSGRQYSETIREGRISRPLEEHSSEPEEYTAPTYSSRSAPRPKTTEGRSQKYYIPEQRYEAKTETEPIASPNRSRSSSGHRYSSRGSSNKQRNSQVVETQNSAPSLPEETDHSSQKGAQKFEEPQDEFPKPYIPQQDDLRDWDSNSIPSTCNHLEDYHEKPCANHEEHGKSHYADHKTETDETPKTSKRFKYVKESTKYYSQPKPHSRNRYVEHHEEYHQNPEPEQSSATRKQQQATYEDASADHDEGREDEDEHCEECECADGSCECCKEMEEGEEEEHHHEEPEVVTEPPTTTTTTTTTTTPAPVVKERPRYRQQGRRVSPISSARTRKPSPHQYYTVTEE